MSRRPRPWIDRLGVAASALCLVHCLATPACVVLVPLAAADGFEGTLALGLLGLASVSWALALARGDRLPGLPLAVAVIALGVRGALDEGTPGEHLTTIVAALALALTHLLSLRPRSDAAAPRIP
ncbi:MAG: MerC domain-containing protein [Nannocystaceae bacterium]